MCDSKMFEIEYTDPRTGEKRVVREWFHGDDQASALFYAEDYAYTVADKGPYKIRESK